VPSNGGRRVGDRLVHSSRPEARGRVPLTRLIDLPDPDRPLLLVNDHPRLVRPDVVERVERIVTGLVQLGWTVTRDPEVEADLRTVLPIRTDAAEVPMTPVLAEKLESHGLGGVLRVIGSATEEDAIHVQVVRPDQVRARTLPVPPRFPFDGGASSTSDAASPAAAELARAAASASSPRGIARSSEAWRHGIVPAAMSTARMEAEVVEALRRSSATGRRVRSEAGAFADRVIEERMAALAGRLASGCRD